MYVYIYTHMYVYILALHTAIPTGALAQTTAPACSRAASRLLALLVAFRLLSFPPAPAMSQTIMAAITYTVLAQACTGLAADLTFSETTQASHLEKELASMQTSSMHISALFRLRHTYVQVHLCVNISLCITECVYVDGHRYVYV